MATTKTTTKKPPKAVQSKAYEFCKTSVRRKTTPKYVKAQMRDFMKVCEGKDKKYKVSEKKLKQLENILKILIMPRGLKAGQNLYKCTTGYQWLFYTAVLCTVYRENPSKRRYETGVLEISRKNFKTYTIATIFIFLFLTEPQFSKFFSVAPTYALSTEIKDAIATTIKSSPLIYEYAGKKRFKILRDYIEFKPNEIRYTPLASNTGTLDGRLPNVFIADEVGAIDPYAINAMRSGQLNILNKLGFIISTKYPDGSEENPFNAEVKYSKQVLDGIQPDETRFSLLYEPDKTEGWETDDNILKQANPVALEIPEIWEDLVKKRAYAIAVDGARENFLTKHCNIVYQSSTETYIDIKDVQACRVNKGLIDWRGRVVYLGIDLSISIDNTAVSMVALDDDNTILADSFCFIPEDRIEAKTATEKVDYKRLIDTGKVFACGDRVIDYNYVENFIKSVEERFGVQVQAIGYDPFNAIASVNRLANDGFITVEVKPLSRILHSATKLLREKVLKGEFEYEENPLLEMNFQNARIVYDTAQNLWIKKSKCPGKIDMVASLITAVHVLEQDALLEQGGFTVQVI